MLNVDPEFRLMRFSTDELPPQERFEVWRDLMNRKLIRLSIDPLTESPYRARAALRALPSLKIALGACSSAIHHATPQNAAEENDDIALIVNLSGSFLVRRQGREQLLGEGDGYLIECCAVASYVMVSPGRRLVVRMRQGVLGAFAKHVDRALGRFIPAETEALKLLVSYARTLPRGDWELSPAANQVVTDHVSDLVALIVGADRDAGALAAGRGLAAARLSAAKAHIRERVGVIDLSSEAVAAEQGISTRYLRQLFEAEEQTFSGYVLEQRLIQAHAMLTSRRFASQPISGIAFEVGFGDLSYFNRVFRRRYERTPREVRAEAIRVWRAG